MSIRAPDLIDCHVGTRIRMRRMELGIKPGHLATELQVTFQQIQKYEKGVNRIGAGRLQHIANLLKVPASFFFENAPSQQLNATQNGNPPEVEIFLTPEGAALAKAFIKIREPKLRRRVVALVEQIADGESSS